jgi:Na+-transporting methylmalonyl-CoA/oxaloacetate decarboxylase gamma subunit
MAASQADRDGRFLVAVLVAMNALAIAAVFELGGVLRVFVLLSLLAVLVTGIGLWIARTVDRGRGRLNEAT